jgi:hypothetical protein
MIYHWDELIRAYVVILDEKTLTIPDFAVLEEMEFGDTLENALERIATDRLKYGD